MKGLIAWYYYDHWQPGVTRHCPTSEKAPLSGFSGFLITFECLKIYIYIFVFFFWERECNFPFHMQKKLAVFEDIWTSCCIIKKMNRRDTQLVWNDLAEQKSIKLWLAWVEWYGGLSKARLLQETALTRQECCNIRLSCLRNKPKIKVQLPLAQLPSQLSVVIPMEKCFKLM